MTRTDRKQTSRPDRAGGGIGPGDPATSVASPFHARELWILALLLTGTAAAFDVLFYGPTLEDAFITFRYAAHLAQGHGIGAWNISGERVEGFTSLLWMLLAAAAQGIGLNMVTVTKVAGMVSHLALLNFFILYPLLPRREQEASDAPPDLGNTPVLCGVVVGLYLPLAWYASSGMETIPFACLGAVFLLARRLRYSTAILTLSGVLLLLTRPEGMLLVAAGLAFTAYEKRVDYRETPDLKIVGGACLVTALCIGLYRWVFFKDLVPNTYWAKAGGSTAAHLAWGLLYVRQWSATHVLLVFLCLIGVINAFDRWRRPPRDTAMLARGIIPLLAIYFLYIIKVGGDNYSAFPFWRHVLHIFPLVALLAAFGITRIRPCHRLFHLFLTVTLVLLVNVAILRAHGGTMARAIGSGLQHFPALSHAPHHPYYTWLRSVTTPDTVIASSLGGELPYVVDATHIDMLGLNNRYIARHGTFEPGGLLDSKTDVQWVLAQRPDIIEGYISARGILAGQPLSVLLDNPRHKMTSEMVASPIFQNEYLFVASAPYGDMDRALFARREFCNQISPVHPVQCTSIRNTPLALPPALETPRVGPE
ncbi:MAG: hypothetical protein ACE5IK_01705 [Acidobacteriota bacterium]